jgi:SM-20-related protein
MVLDLNRIRDAIVRWSPYPYFVVAGALLADAGIDVAEAFPAISRPGAIAIAETQYKPAFGELLKELQGEPFRKLISEKLKVDLTGLPTVINVRGLSRDTDGNIHTDTPSKLVTVLMYFNEPGEADESGLRILRNGRNLEDFVEEVPPLLGSMVVFKVTGDCWHGYRRFVGERRSLQLNYLSGIKVDGRHQRLRRWFGHLERKLGG